MNYFESEHAVAVEAGTQRIEMILMLCQVILKQRGIENKGISVYELTSLIEEDCPDASPEFETGSVGLWRRGAHHEASLGGVR